MYVGDRATPYNPYCNIILRRSSRVSDTLWSKNKMKMLLPKSMVEKRNVGGIQTLSSTVFNTRCVNDEIPSIGR